MKWYIDKVDEIKNNEPIYSVCGDDCSVCPRYLANTDEELRQTAEFWYKAGWRDRVVSNDEIKCTGCGSIQTCSFMLLPCTKEHNVTRCLDCENYECDKISQMIIKSNEKMNQCKKACMDAKEFQMLKRAFYEKEKNMRQVNK